MITYEFFLNLKDDHKQVVYPLQFKPHEEDYPEQKFTLEIKEAMRRKLQQESSSKINDSVLNQMISTWIQDIKEGFRETSMTLDLPSLLTEGIQRLQEQGYQKLPEIISPDLTDIEPQIGCLPPLNFV